MAIDADERRHTPWERLPRGPLLLLTGVGAVLAAGTLIGGLLVGLAGALLAVAAVCVVISSLSSEAEFGAYAQGRGLEYVEAGSLPGSTPLLRRGDDRHLRTVLHGKLPGGIRGAIALYTYEEHFGNGQGGHEVESHRFTVVIGRVHEPAYPLAEVYCQRRSGFGFMDGMEDVWRRMARVELESEVFDRRFEIFSSANGDPISLRRLFAPSFILWLTEEAPPGIAFEYSAGTLCVSVRGHLRNHHDLDQLCEAASAIALRFAGRPHA